MHLAFAPRAITLACAGESTREQIDIEVLEEIYSCIHQIIARQCR